MDAPPPFQLLAHHTIISCSAAAVMSFYDANLSGACILFLLHPYRHLPYTLRCHINTGPCRAERVVRGSPLVDHYAAG
jgi:hypothetical protein